jgi:hypothetical protein
MIENENFVMCCFCGERVVFSLAVQIAIKPSQLSNETQTVYCHSKCIDKVLHKDVPRHTDLTEN